MCEHLGPADFSRWLDQAHRQRICHYVRQKYRSLSETDIEDVWSETHNAALEKWRQNRATATERSFDGLLFTIADRRACDMVRRAEVRRRLLDNCREKAQAEAGPDGMLKARRAGDPLEYEELREHVIEAFGKLSEEEWMVLAVYCDEYPKLRGPARLFKALTELFPEVTAMGWTPTTVRRLLNQARAKVRENLREKGYDLDFES